jgi:hypothetical protein
VFPLDLLSVRLAVRMLSGWQVAFVGSPVIRVKSGNSERFQKRFRLQEHFVLAIAEGVSQNFAGIVIDGMPWPTPMCFAVDEAPHLVQLGFWIFSLSNIDDNFMWI